MKEPEIGDFINLHPDKKANIFIYPKNNSYEYDGIILAIDKKSKLLTVQVFGAFYNIYTGHIGTDFLLPNNKEAKIIEQKIEEPKLCPYCGSKDNKCFCLLLVESE